MFKSLSAFAKFFIYLLLFVLVKFLFHTATGGGSLTFDLSSALSGGLIFAGFFAVLLPMLINTFGASKQKNDRPRKRG